MLLVLPVLLYTGCIQKNKSTCFGKEGISQLNLIPVPRKINLREGCFEILPSTVIVAGDDLTERAGQLQDYLCPATGYKLPIKQSPQKNSIIMEINSELESLGQEAYLLTADASGIKISSSTEKGVFWGIQTLRQLLPKDILQSSVVKNIKWEIPAVEIEDYPGFQWRGLMIDYSRTFWDKQQTLKYIDALAFYKLNTLHMHLTDDQGWRLEIKKYPGLTRTAAKFAPEFNEPAEVEGFYTREDIKEIVAYAEQRNINILPEIEMPGHSAEVFSVYPELSCKKDTFRIHPFFKGAGIHEEILCAGNEKVFDFLEAVLDEVIELFPNEYIHIGGDEAPKKSWEECRLCQQRIRDEGLKDEYELQSWFIKRIESYLNEKDRNLIGWVEILEGGLAPNASVMFWKGSLDPIVKAAEKGHHIVMSPTSHLYFDYAYDTASANSSGRFIPTRKVYAYNPVPEGLDPEYHDNILGLQANFWSHIDRTVPGMNRQIFPRLLAMSEVAWTNDKGRDWKEFTGRLKHHLEILEIKGVDYYRENYD